MRAMRHVALLRPAASGPSPSSEDGRGRCSLRTTLLSVLSSNHSLQARSSAPIGYPAPDNTPHFAGSSSVLRDAIRQVQTLARYEHATVLIEGESGTGKSYIARYLHAQSPRAGSVFHQVILSTLDDNLAATDLFGHVSGAYTDARQNRPGHFVSANHGTLFLDEIGKASPAVQRKLLHAIEHREIWPVGSDRSVRLDVRLVAASNIALGTLVERNTFLDDLAARLVSFRVRVPSLRERREDIPELVRQFVALRSRQCGYLAVAPRIDRGLMRALQDAEWPFNLRQLDAAIQRILIEGAGSSVLTVDHCEREFGRMGRAARVGKEMPSRELVRERMKQLSSVTLTARSLGISRWTVYRYLDRAS